jgi:hypothetical protein
MNELTEVAVRLVPEDADDLDDVVVLSARLRTELRDADLAVVEPMTAPGAPEHAKGLEALVGWLAVRLSIDRLRALIGATQEWASRNKRTVEVSYGGDVLKLTGVTVAQQEKIIDDWIARHSPRT